MHQVAVGHSKDVLQTSDVALGFDLQWELRTSADNAVAEHVAVVLGRTTVVTDDGELLVNHHAETCEQAYLGGGQANAARAPDAAGSVGGVGDVGLGQHASCFQPCCYVRVDSDAVDGVGALAQQVLRSSDGGW